jgi:hypothetical protein
MWVARRLHRAAQPLDAGPATPGETAAPDAATSERSEVVVSLIRSELDRLIDALSGAAGAATARPDSPALLATALTTAIAAAGGVGRPTVRRSPAGLYTAEYWHIEVADADDCARDLVRRLTADARLG